MGYKFFYVGNSLCVIPDGVTHNLSDQHNAFPTIDKFGMIDVINTNSTPEDVWIGDGLHPGLQTPGTLTFTGGANDTLLGTGAQKINAHYNSADGTRIVEDLDMNGATGVSASTQAIAATRVEVTQWGAAGPNDDDIVGAIGGTTVSLIIAGAGQTEQAWWFVPKDHTGYITNWYALGGKKQAAYAKLSLRVHKLAALGTGTAGVIKRRGILASQGSDLFDPRPIALVLPECTQIWVRCDFVSADAMSFAAGFDGVYLPNL